MFRLNCRGLRRVSIEAMKVRARNGGELGVFQKFYFAVNLDTSQPKLNPSTISRLVYYRSGLFAMEIDRVVTFRIYLYGRSTADKEWEKQVRITIDPDELDEDLFGVEDDSENGEVVEGHDEETQGDVEEGDDDEYDEQSDEVAYDDPPPQRTRTRSGEQGEIVNSTPSRLPAAVQVSPVVAEAQRMGLPTSSMTPIQVNPDFIVDIISESQAAAVKFFQAAGQENRRILRTMRRECTALAREARRTMKAVTDDAISQRRVANDHAQKLGQQLIDTTELNASHYENFQKIAQQGWTAFRHSMETEMAQFERMREYERTIYGERIARAEEAASAPVGPPAWPGLLNRAIPGALGVAAAVMAERGNAGMANLLGNLANLLTPKQPLDEEDYENDDEEYEEEEPQRRTRRSSSNGRYQAPSAPHPNASEAAPSSPPSAPTPPPDETVRAAPTRDGARELFASLTPDQVVKLREKMPRGAWEAFEEAANARSESTARASVAKLDALVRNDQLAQAAVLSVLKPDQSAKLFALIQQRPRRTAPPRPSAHAT